MKSIKITTISFLFFILVYSILFLTPHYYVWPLLDSSGYLSGEATIGFFVLSVIVALLLIIFGFKSIIENYKTKTGAFVFRILGIIFTISGIILFAYILIGIFFFQFRHIN